MKKYRNELKFICNEMQLHELEMQIKKIMHLDPHAQELGYYIIKSIYFDDYKNSYFYANKDGDRKRKKYRIRIYNNSENPILLECKEKQDTLTCKNQYHITKKMYDAILSGTNLNISNIDAPFIKTFFVNLRQLKPAIIVQYHRVPYIYPNGNVRITFDRNISSAMDFSNFFNNELMVRPIMPTGYHILEIKYDEYLPNYLYNILSYGTLFQTSFSKYSMCRKYNLHGVLYGGKD